MADLEGLVAGEWGKTITLTMGDSDGDAQDISAFDGEKVVVFRAPNNRTTKTATCAFTTDAGVDGKVTFAFTSGVYLDIAGQWEAQVELQNAAPTIITKSSPFTVDVKKGLR